MHTPRYYQRDAVTSVLLSWEEIQRVILHAPTSAGKNFIAAKLIEHLLPERCLFLGDQCELVFQPADAISRFAGVVPAIEKAEYKAKLGARVVVASMQSLSRQSRLERYPSDYFSYIFVDECFTSKVQVDGRSIADIRPGEFISAFDEASGKILRQRVVRVFRSIPTALMRVSIGGVSIDCTPNHPFLTPHGWTSAKDLMFGMPVLSSVDVYHKLCSVRKECQDSVLLPHRPEILFQGVPMASTQESTLLGMRKGIHAQQIAETIPSGEREDSLLARMPRLNAFQEEIGVQSDAGRSFGSEEAIRHVAPHWMEASDSRRKWEGASIATASHGDGFELANRSSHFHQYPEKLWISDMLQGGYSQCGFKDRNRDRWIISQLDFKAGAGCQERELLDWIGVDGIAVHEPTSDGEFGGVCPGGFVYNLEVEGTHTYLANGAVVHNCHRSAKQKDKIAKYFQNAKVVGMSATPFLSSMKDLSEWYDGVAYSLPMLDLIGEGFAPPLEVLTIPVEINLAGVEQKRGFDGKDYDAESLSTTIEPYYERIIELLKEHADNRHTIVFLPLIKSSEAFAAIARRAGITARHVDGKSTDRDEILEAFKRGHFQMLTNANLVSTGVDIPIADTFVNLRPTKSAVLYQQGVGRIMRVLPGIIDDIPDKHQSEERKRRIFESSKKTARIIDFLWQHDKLGIMRAANLIAGNEADALGLAEKIKKQRTPEQLESIARAFQEEKEALLVRQLEEVASRKGARIAPDAFGFMIGNRHIQNYEPQVKWQADHPTDKQLAVLARWGIEAEAVDSKGLASTLIDNLIFRSKNHLASIKQMSILKENGIPFDPLQTSSQEAIRLIQAAKLRLMRKAA